MFELSKGGKLPLSPVLTPAWVQLPCGARLGGTESATFRTMLGEEQGCPSLRKGMQILFKRDERKLTKYGQVWTLSAQPSPHPGSRHLFSTPTPPPLNYLTGTEIILEIC